MRTRRTQILAPLLWSTCSLGGLVALAGVGRGDPRFDVPTDPTVWPEWWSSGDPLDAAAALGRWIAVVLLGYLAVLALLHLAAALAPRGRLRRVANAATPRFLTGLLAGAVVVAGSSTVGASAPVPTTTTTPGSNPPVMRVIDATTRTTTSTAPPSTVVVPPAPTATIPSLPTTAVSAPPPPPAPERRDPAVPQVEPAATLAAPQAESTNEVVVRQGDHLWAIAERTLTVRLGSVPTDAETAGYWHRLIDANRDRLVDPHDPSLIHPGQRLVLPT